MTITEKKILTLLAKTKKIQIKSLGVRFDKVATRVTAELREFAEKTVPKDITMLLSITAPIRLPRQTTTELLNKIDALAARKNRPNDQISVVGGNNVQIRMIKHSNGRVPRLLGIVHNRTSDAKIIFALFEEWLDHKRTG